MTTRIKSACVIGSAGGIGRAVAGRLSRDGWSPVIRMDHPDAAAAEADTLPIDVTEESSVAAAFARAQEDCRHLDLLVVTAGVLDLEKSAVVSVERWRRVIDVNLTGTFLCCRAARDWLSDGGRIVLMSSLAARTGGVLTGVAYAASKGGVESLAKALAQELAPRLITVNCVAPGGVDTPMYAQNTPETRAAAARATPLKRAATAHEIAGAVAYLASEDAALVTGTVLPVNGGLRMD